MHHRDFPAGEWRAPETKYEKSAGENERNGRGQMGGHPLSGVRLWIGLPDRRICGGCLLYTSCNENIPAICAGTKAKEKLEPRARSASRLSLGRCNENIPAICAGVKAKEKLEPRAHSASRQMCIRDRLWSSGL